MMMNQAFAYKTTVTSFSGHIPASSPPVATRSELALDADSAFKERQMQALRSAE
jgi:hypothetical protein